MIGLHLWFLVGSILLPRVCLFFAWYGDPPFSQMESGFVVGQPWPALLWIFLPRVLVMIVIQSNLGFGMWFWIHLVAAIVVWGSCAANVSSS
jgi:hypothetical protein